MVSSSKKVKQKQAMLKMQKSISFSKHAGGSGNLDNNDDFMPMKKAATAKACKLITPVGGTSGARLKAKSSDGASLTIMAVSQALLHAAYAMLSALGSNARKWGLK